MDYSRIMKLRVLKANFIMGLPRGRCDTEVTPPPHENKCIFHFYGAIQLLFHVWIFHEVRIIHRYGSVLTSGLKSFGFNLIHGKP